MRALAIIVLCGACFPLHDFKQAPPPDAAQSVALSLDHTIITLLAGDKLAVGFTASDDATLEVLNLPPGVSAEVLATRVLLSSNSPLGENESTAVFRASAPGMRSTELTLTVRTSSIERVQVAPLGGLRGSTVALDITLAQPEALAAPISAVITTPLATVTRVSDLQYRLQSTPGQPAAGNVAVTVTHGDITLPPRTVPLQLRGTPGLADAAFGAPEEDAAEGFIAVADAKLVGDSAYFVATTRDATHVFARVGRVSDTGAITILQDVIDPANPADPVYPTSIEVDGAGRMLIVARKAQHDDAVPSVSIVARLLADGSYDVSFGSGGVVYSSGLDFQSAALDCGLVSAYDVGGKTAIFGHAASADCHADRLSMLYVVDAAGANADTTGYVAMPPRARGTTRTASGGIVGYGLVGQDGTRGAAFRADALVPPVFTLGAFSLVVTGNTTAGNESLMDAGERSSDTWLFAGYSDRGDARQRFFAARVTNGSLAQQEYFAPPDSTGDARLTSIIASSGIALGDYYRDGVRRVGLIRLNDGYQFDADSLNELEELGADASAGKLLYDASGRAWIFACSANTGGALADCMRPTAADTMKTSKLRVMRVFVD